MIARAWTPIHVSALLWSENGVDVQMKRLWERELAVPLREAIFPLWSGVSASVLLLEFSVFEQAEQRIVRGYEFVGIRVEICRHE